MDNRDNSYKNIRIVELAKYEQPIIVESKKENWVEYGEQNNHYQYLIDRYTYSPTNNAVINNIAKLIYGKGLKATNASAKPNDWASLMTIIKKADQKKHIIDLKMLGQAGIQIIYNKDRTVKNILHIPTQLLRPEKCNKDGIIEAYYYSDNWQDLRNFPPTRIPAYGTSKELIEIYMVQPYTVGMKYFAYPDYQGALPYTVLEQEISDYLINEVQNGFSGTKIVNFNNGVPTEEEMDETESRVVGKLTGSKGKRVIVSFNNDEKFKTTVDDIALNDAPQHYEYLADECTRKILLGHNVTSPLLFGISSTNGFSSNADELKNSFVLYYNMVIKPFQELLIDAYEMIISNNGISLNLYFDTLKPLEFTNALGVVETDQQLKKVESEDNTEMLIALGEKPKDNWILIDEYEVDYQLEDIENEHLSKLNQKKTTLMSKIVELVSTGTARPNAKSEQDEYIDGIKFITRYRYDGDIKSNTRAFCSKMVNAKKIYRKEDIISMEKQEVNKGWGPRGANVYDIWQFKGGAMCHHKWMKQVYVAFSEGLGIDVYNPNAKTIAVERAEKVGYKVINPSYVSERPVDMPNQGFLPSNKRFKNK
jgi:hypothetical protein